MKPGFISVCLLAAWVAGVARTGEGAPVYSARSAVKPAEPALAQPAGRPPSLQAGLPAPVARVRLPPLDLAPVQQEDAQRDREGKTLRIGVYRSLTDPAVLAPAGMENGEWTALPDGGHVWRLTIESPGALGLRVRLTGLDLPASCPLVVYPSGDPGRMRGPYFPGSLAGQDYLWTGMIFADAVTVECYGPPGVSPAEVKLQADQVIHLYRDPLVIAKEGDCHLDVTCYPEWAAVGHGVAGLGTPGVDGYIWCTGCLLNDQDDATFIDYFMTANHCVANQAEASDTEFYWFFETATCNGSPPSINGVPTTDGGATYLAGLTYSAGNDFSFLRLRKVAPGGVTFAGWTTDAPATNATLVGIHHPDGAYKRISLGTLRSSNADMWNVRWSEGVTEPGSSGSPLFNENREFVGQLYGGASSCGNPSGLDYYGRFDVSFPYIRSWLAASNLTLVPISRIHPATASTGQTVMVTANVAWTAVTTVAWMELTGGATGTGSGTVTYAVQGNTGSARTGAVVVAGGGLSATCRVVQSAGTPQAGYALRFFGTGTGDIDRVKIQTRYKPVNVGSNFTLECWLKGNLADNPAGPVASGSGDDWVLGHIVLDRDIFGSGDYGDYGLSLAQGRVAFGVNNGSAGYTLVGNSLVLDGAWHHIAVTRQTGGAMRIFVDGRLDAFYGAGPAGRVNYRNERSFAAWTNDPFLVLGAEKHDYDRSTYPSFNGWLDELRISSSDRYTNDFAPPLAPFAVDADTVGLYHLDAGVGSTISDDSGGGSSGERKPGGPGDGPVWTTDNPFGGAAASLAISPGLTNVPAVVAGNVCFEVNANVTWTATSRPPWLVITEGSYGIGDGFIACAVLQNSSSQPRTGSLVVTGGSLVRTASVVQAAGVSLRVISPYGAPVPVQGTNWFALNQELAATLSGSPVGIGAFTQYACVGWTGKGSVPPAGSGTNTGPFTLTTNSTLTWLWRTNYWLETAASGSGTVSVASGWFARGSNVAIRATPQAGSRFFRWTGSATGTSTNLTVGMTGSKSVTALFGVNLSVQAQGLDGSVKNVAIRTAPGDVDQTTSRTTPCTFGYTNGTVVHVSAPQNLSGGWSLVGWTGVDAWTGTNATLIARSNTWVSVLYSPAPVVVITNPTASTSFTTTNRTLTLKGRATSPGGLTRVEVSNARSERNQPATGTTNWAYAGLPLYPGVNPITVAAFDIYGNASTDTLSVTCSAESSAIQGLALLAGAVVRDIQMPDNLVPGVPQVIRWQMEAYEPVRSALRIRLPAGTGVTHVVINGQGVGTSDGTWRLGGWVSKVYSFEAEWVPPNRPGLCRVRFLASRMDGFAYMNANIPDGIETASHGLDGKEISRTIVPGGTDPGIQSEVLIREAKTFETVTDAQRRAGGVIRSISFPDNLVPGSVVTCTWSVLSYPAVVSRLHIQLPVESAVSVTGALKTTSNSWWRLPTTGTLVEYDASATNDAVGKVSKYVKMSQRNLQAVWTVPNDPGPCRIGFEVALAKGGAWVGGVLREEVDGRIETNQIQIVRDIVSAGFSPQPLTLGVTNTTGSIQYPGDADWYSFTAATPGTYRVQTYLGTLNDTILKLYGPEDPGLLLGQNDNAVGLASRLLLPLEPGRYFVKITAPPSKTGSYRLVVEPSP